MCKLTETRYYGIYVMQTQSLQKSRRIGFHLIAEILLFQAADREEPLE
jgi:hypothetical protein